MHTELQKSYHDLVSACKAVSFVNDPVNAYEGREQKSASMLKWLVRKVHRWSYAVCIVETMKCCRFIIYRNHL